MTTVGKVEAIKEFFGSEKPIVNQELIALRRADPKGFDEMAAGAAAALGKTLKA